VWAFEHNHNELMLRAALRDLWRDCTFGTSGSIKNRVATLAQVPNEYMVAIWAKSSMGPSLSLAWTSLPYQVDEFLKSFKPIVPTQASRDGLEATS
jgi:hypothetical protein